MKTIKILFGFLPGITFAMWMKAIWFCIALSICNPSDDAPLWFVGLLLLNLVAATLAVASDRERWKNVCDNYLNEE